ncbi:MAG: MarC family protein [Chlamydiales bacterium]|nr:MarC family protein [Chlamydiales bacterium]
MTLISLVLILFFIMDPIGNIASFQTVLEGTEPKRQRVIILREMAIALGMMILFYIIGEALLGFLQLSEITLRITSGLVLFLVGIGILFPGPSSIRETLKPEPNPILVPLAIPLTSGPALLASVMLFARLDETNYIVPLAILISWVMATVVQYFGAPLQRTLGKNTLMGAERLCGMILVMLAIQRFAEGVQLFISTR